MHMYLTSYGGRCEFRMGEGSLLAVCTSILLPHLQCPWHVTVTRGKSPSKDSVMTLRGAFCACRSVVVRTPAQLLADGIGGSASGLTVYRRRQLPLTPDLSERDLTNLLIGYAR